MTTIKANTNCFIVVPLPDGWPEPEEFMFVDMGIVERIPLRVSLRRPNVWQGRDAKKRNGNPGGDRIPVCLRLVALGVS